MPRTASPESTSPAVRLDLGTRVGIYARYALVTSSFAASEVARSPTRSEPSMKHTNGAHRPEDGPQILGLFLALEESKAAIKRYENGEINIREALRIIALAACSGDAA